MRAKVEQPFLVIKRLFDFAKTRYRGLDKNSNRLFVTCVLTNLSPHATAIVTHYVGDMQRFLVYWISKRLAYQLFVYQRVRC